MDARIWYARVTLPSSVFTELQQASDGFSTSAFMASGSAAKPITWA